MGIGRLHEFAKGVRHQQRNSRRWGQEAPAGKLKPEFWSGPEPEAESKLRSESKPAGREDPGQIWPQDATPEVTTSPDATGMSVWEGVVPDPVGPKEPGQPVAPGRLGQL